MIKFAIKLGLASSAVYYINEQGIWKKSSESVKTLEKFKGSFKPYIQEVKVQIPFKLPELPESDNLSSLIKQNWNNGVLTMFKFISNLPQTVRWWTSKGLEKATENPEFKKIVESFSVKIN